MLSPAPSIFQITYAYDANGLSIILATGHRLLHRPRGRKSLSRRKFLYLGKKMYFLLRILHKLIKPRVSSRAVIFFFNQKANVVSFTAEGCTYFHVYCHFYLKWHFPILVQPVVPKYNLRFELLEKSLDFLCMLINFLYTMRMKCEVTSSTNSLY